MVSSPTVSFADAQGTPSNTLYGSSPTRRNNGALGQVTPREGIVPLGAAKTIAALTSRRGVNFSPSNDTKYFLATDSILPLKDIPPPSCRAYPDPPSSDAVEALPSTPCADTSRSGTPINSRSILKSRTNDIRLASTVEEGTLNNKEAARLLVCGKRPRLMARDSFQLAMMQKAAGDGLDKGKEKAVEGSDEACPSSDDSVASDGAPPVQIKDGSSEMEEDIEETGPLSTSSLVSIILDGAEDLLTLEEAYSVLLTNLRTRIPADIPEQDIAAVTRQEMQITVSAIKDEAPAMVRAMLRDLQRVLGKVPNSEVVLEADHTPFRGLMPLRDTTPTHGSRLTPTSTPTNLRIISPDGQPKRKGYNEAEVRYRREAAGVGSAILKFLACVFNTSILFSCFSDADITALLEQVLAILRTPSLPTPNPKRTYYNSLTIIAQMRVPTTCVVPVKEKIARALESTLAEGVSGSPDRSPGLKDNNSQIKKECFHAVTNLFSNYSSVFFPHYAELLPACLRGLRSPAVLFRNKAAAAIAALTSAKLNVLADTSSQDAWTKNKAIVQKLESFTVTHLKSALRFPMKSTMQANTGEKRTEWLELERVFKDTVGSAEGVVWACATWAVLVTLMGSAYATSGLATSFNHIMDRSLQPSTNIVRPLLARIAWSHAIYAYMLSGSMISSDNGTLISTYRPFMPSSSGNLTERIGTIQLSVDLSMSLAANQDSSSIVISDAECRWERVEKAKKAKWMCHTGLGAAAVVYAYSGTALFHQDQPAKEMSAITGLPSSDGVQVTEADKELAAIERLDKAWERVVQPILRTYGGLRGVDRLKVHGWAMMDAITLPQSSPSWSLDKLLSRQYLSGEVFNDKVDKDEALHELLEALDKGPIKAADIPSWGSAWIVRRLDKLLDLYQDMLSGVYGLAEISLVKWQRDQYGNNILPTSLYKIWTNLMRAVASGPIDSRSLRLIVRHLTVIFNRNPSTHTPLANLDPEGNCKVDADTLRFGLFDLLLDAAISALGRDALGATRIDLADGNEVDQRIADLAFGSDANKAGTAAGQLLAQVVRSAALKFPMAETAINGFTIVATKLLKLGCVTGFSGKLLGDITNQMPFLLQEQEELQLVLWRQLALRWVEVVDLQPTTSSTGTTNHTGVLLVSLLSCPFRERRIDSQWHQNASKDDFAAWEALLKVTVLRFRARGVGSNYGVLESLAGHLGDFLEAGPKTSSSTITLSCLNAAMGYLSFVEPQPRHSDHFSINENYVPADFLTLVSNALVESYPSIETQADSNGTVISPAVADLIGTITERINNLPTAYTYNVISQLQSGLAVWMQDEGRVVLGHGLSELLDNLYITLLAALGNACEDGHLSSSAETMDELINLFAPRLSRAQSTGVPIAFKEFYTKTFPNVTVEEMSPAVRGFLEDVLAAVPGMVSVPGLIVKDTFSQEESEGRYPHAQALASDLREPDTAPVKTTEVDVTDNTVQPQIINEMDITANVSEEYDADVSQSHSQAEQAVERLEKVSTVPALSPIPSEGSREASEDLPEASPTVAEKTVPVKSEEEDVFGPANPVRVRKTARRPKKRSSRSRPLGDSESLPIAKRAKNTDVSLDSSHSLPDTVVAPLVPTSSDKVEMIEIEDDDAGDCILVSNSPPPGSSSVARNTLSRPWDNSEPEVVEPIRNPSRSTSVTRNGLLTSARSWIANVFKSPTTPVALAAENANNLKAASISTSDSSRTKRRSEPKTRRSASSTPTDTDEPATMEGSESQKSPTRDSTPSQSVQSVKSVRRSRRRSAKGNTPKPERQMSEQQSSSSLSNVKSPLKRIMVEEDDELLLSPETAQKRRKEEEGDIASSLRLRRSKLFIIPPTNSGSPASRRTRSRAKITSSISMTDLPVSQQSSGRFDDAEETQLDNGVLTPTHEKIINIPPTPAQRPSNQAKLLKMMEEASNASEVIEDMDLEGVLAFTRHLDKMRISVQANLERRAIAEKAHRRK